MFSEVFAVIVFAVKMVAIVTKPCTARAPKHVSVSAPSRLGTGNVTLLSPC